MALEQAECQRTILPDTHRDSPARGNSTPGIGPLPRVQGTMTGIAVIGKQCDHPSRGDGRDACEPVMSGGATRPTRSARPDERLIVAQ